MWHKKLETSVISFVCVCVLGRGGGGGGGGRGDCVHFSQRTLLLGSIFFFTLACVSAGVFISQQEKQILLQTVQIQMRMSRHKSSNQDLQCLPFCVVVLIDNPILNKRCVQVQK